MGQNVFSLNHKFSTEASYIDPEFHRSVTRRTASKNNVPLKMCSLGSRSEAFKTVVLLSADRPDPLSFQTLFPHLYLWLCFHWRWRKQCWLQVTANSFLQLRGSETRRAPQRHSEVMESLSHAESGGRLEPRRLPVTALRCLGGQSRVIIARPSLSDSPLFSEHFLIWWPFQEKEVDSPPAAFPHSWCFSALLTLYNTDHPSQRSLAASVLDDLKQFSSTALNPRSHKWPGMGVSGHWSCGIFPLREQLYSDAHTHPHTHPSTHTSVFCRGFVQRTQHHSVQPSRGRGSSYWKNAAHIVSLSVTPLVVVSHESVRSLSTISIPVKEPDMFFLTFLCPTVTLKRIS